MIGGAASGAVQVAKFLPGMISMLTPAGRKNSKMESLMNKGDQLVRRNAKLFPKPDGVTNDAAAMINIPGV